MTCPVSIGYDMSHLRTHILKEGEIDLCGTKRIAWQVNWEPIHAPMKGQFQYHGHMPQSRFWNNTEANLSTHERRQYAQGDITMTGALYIVLSN